MATTVGQESLARKQLDVVYRRYSFGLLSSLAISSAVVAALWSEVPAAMLVGWLLALWVVMAVRGVYARRFLRIAHWTAPIYRRWHAGAAMGTAAAGGCWGATVFLVPAGPLDPGGTLVIFVIAGVSAFACVSMAGLPRVAEAFLIPALMPLVLWLFSFDERTYQIMGAITLVYMGLMVLFARQMHGIVNEALSSAQQNRELNSALAQVHALERESALFRSMVEHTRDPAIFLLKRWEPEGVLYVNDAVCRHFGAPREQVMSWRLSDWDPDFDAVRAEVLNAELQRAGSTQFETRHRVAGGAMIPVEVTLNVIDFQGESFLVGYFRSLVQRKAEEASLCQLELAAAQRESERRMMRYFEAAPGFFFALHRDTEGRMSMPFASAGMAALCGVAPEAVKNTVEPLVGLYHPDDAARVRAEVERAARTRTHFHTEFRLLHPEWGERWVEARSMPLQEDGATTWCGFMHDVTARKRAEADLAKREREWRTLMENLPDNIARWDVQGRYTYLNPAHERTLGRSAKDVLGKTINEITGASSCEGATGVDRVLAANGPVLLPRVPVPGEGGETRLHDLNLVPEFDVGNRIISVLGIGRDMTEHYRMQEAVAAREQEFRSLAESSPDYIIRYDREGRMRYLNTALVTLLGVGGVGSVIGKRPSETWPDGRFEVIEQAAARAIETDGAQTIELLAPRQGGGIGYSQVHVVPERDVNGDIIGTIAFGRDVTELKRMDEDVRRQARFQRSLLDAMNQVGLQLMIIQEGCITYASNRALTREFGYSEAEVGAGVPLREIIHPDHRERVMDYYRRRMAGQPVPTSYELSLITRAGERREYETAVAVVADSAPMRFITVGKDITERKRMEDALAARERDFRSLLDNTPDPVVRYDRECRRIFVNQAWARVNGVPRETVLGKSPAESSVRVRPYAAEFEKMLRRVMDSGRDESMDLTWSGEDGELVCFALKAIPEFDAKGEVPSVLTVARDITERKRMEQRLQHALNFSEGVINAIPDILLEMDGEGRYLNVWTRQPELLPAQRAQLIGRSVDEVLSPDAAASAMAAIREADQRELSFGTVIRIDTLGGDAWFEVSVSRIRAGATPSASRFLMLSRDVTERVHMETALAAREREMRTLIENSPDTIARYDRSCRRTYANPAFCERVEGGAAVLLGKRPTEAPGGKQSVVYETKIQEVLDTGNPVEFEFTWSDKEGKEICSLLGLTAERDAAGNVVSVLAVGRDITELSASRQKIHQMAFYDALTSLPNRALFNDRLRYMLNDASWHGQLVGLMMLDVDRFKSVNDTLGHAAGDELLREVAGRLTRRVRAYDTVARLSGDEFALLLPEIRSADDLGVIAGKLLEVFEEPFLLEGKEVFVSSSIGIAVYPHDGTQGDDLLKYADSAMYFAKRSGRGSFRFYSRDLTVSANERLMLEADLRRGFARGELELHFQPKVRLSDGDLIGTEALLRWRHPTRGMVPPDKFIGIAEDSGLIVEIGEWVLRSACSTAREWNRGGRSAHKVAINLSARQFQADDLAKVVRTILQETRCRPEWIELEITESLLLEEAGDVLETLAAFRTMGIGIAIDDFGTGYSALSYLARYPIDVLKIDRSFIGRLGEYGQHAELVKAIISIAKCLKQQVVAEGVETAEQARVLQSYGCDMAQGYFYGKPMPRDSFEEHAGLRLESDLEA